MVDNGATPEYRRGQSKCFPEAPVLHRVIGGLLLAVTAAGLAGLLHAAWCVFSNGTFAFVDYGVYTNAIWNTSRFHFLEILGSESYLSSHLSFSIALLAPVFWIWNHPFALMALQWAMLVAGAVITLHTAKRRCLPLAPAAAIVLFFCLYGFAQAVVLNEFHGLAMYLVLVPWLFDRLSGRSLWAWLPLVILLGVREDAFIVVVPMLLYIAVRERWAPAWSMLAASTLFGVFELTVLFPLINREPITETRSGLLDVPMLLTFWQGKWLDHRIAGYAWLLLPMLPFLRFKRWLPRLPCPLWFFPSAFAVTMAFAYLPTYFGLTHHYGTPALVTLTAGMMQTLIERRREGVLPLSVPYRALALSAVVAVSHVMNGFLPGGGNRTDEYAHPNPDVDRILTIARSLPERGFLFTEPRLTGFAANRRLIADSLYLEMNDVRPDLFFYTVTGFRHAGNGEVLQRVREGTLTVDFFDGDYVVASDHGSMEQNDAMVARILHTERLVRMANFEKSGAHRAFSDLRGDVLAAASDAEGIFVGLMPPADADAMVVEAREMTEDSRAVLTMTDSVTGERLAELTMAPTTPLIWDMFETRFKHASKVDVRIEVLEGSMEFSHIFFPPAP